MPEYEDETNAEVKMYEKLPFQANFALKLRLL
jgi:hypothetical protein